MKGTQEVQGIIISHLLLSGSLDKLYDPGIQTVTWMYFSVSSPNGSPSCPRLSTSQEELSTKAPTEPRRNWECFSRGRRCSAPHKMRLPLRKIHLCFNTPIPWFWWQLTTAAKVKRSFSTGLSESFIWSWKKNQKEQRAVGSSWFQGLHTICPHVDNQPSK